MLISFWGTAVKPVAHFIASFSSNLSNARGEIKLIFPPLDKEVVLSIANISHLDSRLLWAEKINSELRTQAR